MRLLIINAECGLGGGPAVITNSIYKAATENGIETLVAYGRQANNNGVSLYRISSKSAVYMHVFLSRLFDMEGEGSYASTKRFLRIIDTFAPDIICLQNIHGYYLNYTLLFKYIKRNNIPVVWTFHDCWPFTGHCAYYDRINCDRWKKCCERCPQIHDYPKSLLFDRSKHHYLQKKELYGDYHNLTIVTPSNWLKDEVGKSFLKNVKCVVIHNGIDLKKYYPIKSNFKQEKGLLNKKIILGVASRWSGRKGLEDFIRLSKIIDSNYQIVLVGLSKEEISKIPNTILGIDRTDNLTDLLRIYSAADVFVNASIEDNFPTVILEALACGTPVVTYDTGGSKEAIDINCGRVVEQRNVTKLKEAIDELFKLSNLPNACLTAIEKFNENFIYKQYINLFFSILHFDINNRGSIKEYEKKI